MAEAAFPGLGVADQDLLSGRPVLLVTVLVDLRRHIGTVGGRAIRRVGLVEMVRRLSHSASLRGLTGSAPAGRPRGAHRDQ